MPLDAGYIYMFYGANDRAPRRLIIGVRQLFMVALSVYERRSGKTVRLFGR